MAIYLKNTAQPISVISSSAANDLTKKNQTVLRNNINSLGIGGDVANFAPTTSGSSFQSTGIGVPNNIVKTTSPTNATQNRPATPGSVPVSSSTQPTAQTTGNPQVPQIQGVIPPSNNPTVQSISNQINDLVNQAGYLSPENQASAQSINQLYGQEMIKLNQANQANQTGDYRSLNQYLTELEEVRANKEKQIEDLYGSLSSLRSEYATAAAPTETEVETQQKLADIQKEAADYALATNRAVSGLEGQGRGIPISLVRGQQKKLVEQRSYGATEIANQEANLLTQLGLEQDARKLRSDIALNQISSVTDNIELLGKAVDRVDSQSNNYVTRFTALDDQQQKTLDSLLERVAGLRYDELDPASKNYVNNLAKNLGIDVSIVKDGMKAVADKQEFDEMIKRSELAISASKATGGGGLSGSQEVSLRMLENNVISDKIVNKAYEAQALMSNADRVLANPGDRTNQLVVLYSFIKALDPDSAVREGEVTLADAATSYLERFQTTITKLSKGQTINPKLAQELAQASKDLAKVRIDVADSKLRSYGAAAQSQGIGEQFSQFLDTTKSSYSTSLGTTSGVPSDVASAIEEDISNGVSLEDIRTGLAEKFNSREIGYGYLDQYMQNK